MTSRIRSAIATVTRPGDTNSYTAGDELSNIASVAAVPLKFAIGGKDGFGSIIKHASCVVSVAAATKPDIELFLFSAAIAMVGDNAAFAPTDAEMLTCLGVIAFPVATFKVAGPNVICDVKPVDIILPSLNVVYAVPVLRNAYAPSASEVFQFRLGTQE